MKKRAPEKTGKGYAVLMTDEVQAQLKSLPPDVLEEVERLMQGFQDGTIDPKKVGKRLSKKELAGLARRGGK